ncbi:Major intrinsic protein [Sesbania bispinosa]|nr:Major intrinsic protein [Sesbania bispinosa]
MVSAIKAAIGDAVLTFMWVFVSSTLGLVTSAITKALDLHLVSYNGLDYPSIIITTLLIFVLVFIFTIIGNALGGASFNPTGNASFYAAGLGSDTLFSMALRFPAQALGAVGGALAIMEVMPPKYRHMIIGPSLKVDLHTGAVAEGVLTFVITFAVLFIMIRGPRSEMVKTWMMAMSTVPLIIAGSTYTGPSMNPALWS